MSTATVRSGFDGWATSAKPALEHARSKTLYLRSGVEESFLYFKVPVPRGATVTSATLTLYARGASSGSRTVSVRRVNESWKQARLNWNNRPTVTGTAATKAIGTLKDRQAVTFDVTGIVASWASGSPNYGVKVYTSAGSRHAFYGLLSSYKPVLTVTWSDAPAKPTNLRPSDAATSLAKPHVTFDYKDYGGNTAVGAVRVEIVDPDDHSIVLYDSGEVATQEAGLDLAEVATAWAGLTEGQTVAWRVMMRDGAGLPSAWSDYVTMTRVGKPTVTITNLSAGLATEPTPPILWSSTGVQTAYEVLVYVAGDTSTAIHDSGVRQGTETAYTIPAGVLTDDETYTVEVRIWDDVVREATPGDDTYAPAQADFYLATDAGVSPVETLTAVQEDLTPWVVLTWTRTTTPDSFAIYRDGKAIVADLDPGEVFVSGTTYSYRYYGARPNRQHVYAVRAVVNGAMSPDGPTPALTTSPSGLWVVDFDRGVDVTLWGDDEGTWNMVDDAAVYTPVGSTEVVRIVNGMRGLEGTLSGLLMEGFGKTFAQMEADVYKIKARPTATVRIIAGDENFEAIIGNVRISPKPETRQGRIVKGVSFDFWQVGELPFDPKI